MSRKSSSPSDPSLLRHRQVAIDLPHPSRLALPHANVSALQGGAGLAIMPIGELVAPGLVGDRTEHEDIAGREASIDQDAQLLELGLHESPDELSSANDLAAHLQQRSLFVVERGD